MQRSAGLYGSIQVDLPDGALEPFRYDDDRSIILNDWWHKSTAEQSVGPSAMPFGRVNEPQSLLINGRGQFDCAGLTPDVCNTSNPECSPYKLQVVAGKTYRLRVSSITSSSALNFEIEGHRMTVVVANGDYVKPFVIKNLNIYSGETYSVLIMADRDPIRNYWIATNIVNQRHHVMTGLGILSYHGTTPAFPHMPHLGLLHATSRYDILDSDETYMLEFNTMVDAILQNAYSLASNNSQGHLWHLHGHNVWIWAHRKGMLDLVNDKEKYTVVDLITNKAMLVYPYVLAVAVLLGWIMTLLLVIHLRRYKNAPPSETPDLEARAPVTSQDGWSSLLQPRLFLVFFIIVYLVILLVGLAVGR